mmetsp:Transcript_28141/g.61822  ORF Transcript_28141/g.61822 Transcript_28141/m.61822 type:complete len:241 (+) Transcript_28141:465-1187(+)
MLPLLLVQPRPTTTVATRRKDRRHRRRRLPLLTLLLPPHRRSCRSGPSFAIRPMPILSRISMSSSSILEPPPPSSPPPRRRWRPTSGTTTTPSPSSIIIFSIRSSSFRSTATAVLTPLTLRITAFHQAEVQGQQEEDRSRSAPTATTRPTILLPIRTTLVPIIILPWRHHLRNRSRNWSVMQHSSSSSSNRRGLPWERDGVRPRRGWAAGPLVHCVPPSRGLGTDLLLLGSNKKKKKKGR